MTPTGARRLAWVLFGTAMILAAVGLVLMFLSLDGRANIFGFRGSIELLTTVFASAGFLLASRRPDNPIGWIFLVASVASGVQVVTQEYPVYSGGDRSDFAVSVSLWIDTWLWVPTTGSIGVYVFLLFPTGRLVSRGWRWVVWIGTLGILAFTAAFAVGSDVEELETEPGARNPFFDVGAAVTEPLLYAGSALYLAGTIGSVVSLVVRFRRSRGDERQQLKWFAAAAAIWAFFIAVTFISELVLRDVVVLSRIGSMGTVLGFVAIPGAIGVAILKYRLYDIDVVINRALVFGLLGAFITAVYVGIVVGVGALVGRGGGLVLPGVAAAVVALAFQPARNRARHLANRLVYGRRATPYEVLSEFSDRMGGEYALDEVLPRMARIVAEGTGAAGASVWLRVADELRRAAVWPEAAVEGGASVRVGDGDLPALPSADRALPVTHREELLGALAITKPRGETLSGAEEKLLADLAAQAGLVLRNVRLTEELKANLEELRASRQRIVAAQDEERRRIERNIHDGAQQQLVALSVKQRLAERLVDDSPEKAKALLGELRRETTDALENLRDLARGIYPPLLADQGLGPAVEAQARKSAIPVEVSADGVGRLAQEAEAAVYFCCLEALQNAAKYSGAASIQVRLEPEDGDLSFTVADDGNGFDPGSTPRAQDSRTWRTGCRRSEGRSGSTRRRGRGPG